MIRAAIQQVQMKTGDTAGASGPRIVALQLKLQMALAGFYDSGSCCDGWIGVETMQFQDGSG
jgi:hypothetical protein